MVNYTETQKFYFSWVFFVCLFVLGGLFVFLRQTQKTDHIVTHIFDTV